MSYLSAASIKTNYNCPKSSQASSVQLKFTLSHPDLRSASAAQCSFAPNKQFPISKVSNRNCSIVRLMNRLLLRLLSRSLRASECSAVQTQWGRHALQWKCSEQEGVKMGKLPLRADCASCTDANPDSGFLSHHSRSFF